MSKPTTIPTPGSRIAVIGITGSGKTTVARRLARLYGIPHVELDALHWQPNWVMTDLEPFRRKVDRALSGPAWVADGNYGKVRDLVWPRSNTLVWLDYSLPIVLWQLVGRTFKRVLSREELWNSNRETFRGVFFSKDSLLLWALQTYRPYRKTYSDLLGRPEFSHLQVIRQRSRKETDQWLNELEAQELVLPSAQD